MRKGLNWYLTKDAHQKSEGGSVRSGKKIDSFTLETSKNHLVRNFLRKGRLSPAARSHCKTRSVPIVKFLLPIRLFTWIQI